jgi:hypothetical protein
MKEQDFTKVEFLLKCNENIIVQRFFNVRGFNPKSRMSLDLYEYLSSLCRKIQNDLKMRTVVYMLDNQYEIQENPDILNTSYTDGEENFNLIIKIGDMTICHRVFDAKLYPPKVRYTVDLRPQLKGILSELTDIFSGKKFNFEYAGFKLA